MNVLLINQFFYPDVAPTGQLLTDLAVDLVKKGCQVRVITGRWSYAGDSKRFSRRESFEGVEILRTFSTRFGRRFLLGRLIDYWAFFISALFKGILIKRPDVIVCLTTPPWISLLGFMLKMVKRCKLVCWLQDLYPEIAAKLGVLKEKGRAYSIVDGMMARVLKKADLLVVLSQSMRERLVHKGVNPSLIEVIPNWADGKKICSIEKGKNSFLEKIQLQDKFVVLYSGNMGRCHHFDTLLAVIQQLERFPDILFLFIGDGFGNEVIRKFKESHRLNNVQFLPYQKREDLAQSLSAGSVHLVTLKDGMQDLMVPSKIYAAMAAARPILYVGPQGGEVPRIIESAECGWAVKIGDGEALKEYILKLYQDHSLVYALGNQARRFFDEHFEQQLSTEKFYICLKGLLK